MSTWTLFGFRPTAAPARNQAGDSPLPGQVAEAIWQAEKHRRDVIYVKPVWRVIMQIISALPEFLFKRTRL